VLATPAVLLRPEPDGEGDGPGRPGGEGVADPGAVDTGRFATWAWNSLRVSTIAAVLAVALAVLVAYAVRIAPSPATRGTSQLLTLGYAVPGTVLAVGVLLPVGAVDAFLAGVPDDVIAERLDAVGLPRAAFDEDMQRVRRLVPRPVRRVVNRIPAALELGARVAREAELGPRVRGLISKEGSPA
jgi:iron(III) transport system permease protein